MTLHINKRWLIVSMTVNFLLHASATWSAPNKANLTNVNRSIAYVDIAQTGLQDDAHYVLCNDSDCPYPTVKHRFMADMAKPAPLVMPLPVLDLPTHNVPASTKTPLNPKKVKKRKHQKTAQKSPPQCITEK